jgi:sugar fermentation stimulation protein A
LASSNARVLLIVRDYVGCRIVRRVNRFMVEVEAPWGVEIVHINNTGRLEDVIVKGRIGYCTKVRRPRRLRYRLFSVEYGEGFSLIDTKLQEEAFARAVDSGLLPWARGCRVILRSPKHDGMRFDYLLDCTGEKVLAETKSAVLQSPEGLALYPDCPTARGREHIKLLARLAEKGRRTLLVFIAAFPGAKGFKPYEGGDPEIPRLVREAIKAGVNVRSLGIMFNPKRGTVELYNADLPIILD